jgi:sugar phosphate isomerase/epimerase
MRLGIFAKTFAGQTPEAVLSAVAAAGYETCQYNMACSGLPSLPVEIVPEAQAALEAARERSGVGIAALSATFNMIHPNPAARLEGLQSLNALAGLARALKIPLLTLCTGSRDAKDQWAHHPDNQSPEAWRDLTETMAQALKIAEAHGVALGVEPEHGNVVCDAKTARHLLDDMQSPMLKIVLDPANLVKDESGVAQQGLLAAAIELLAPEISLAHAKDRDTTGKVVPAGNGIVDLDFFLKRLKQSGLEHPVITHGFEASDAPRVAAFLKGLI